MRPVSQTHFARRKRAFAACHALALEKERAARAPSASTPEADSRPTLSLFAPEPTPPDKA